MSFSTTISLFFQRATVQNSTLELLPFGGTAVSSGRVIGPWNILVNPATGYVPSS